MAERRRAHQARAPRAGAGDRRAGRSSRAAARAAAPHEGEQQRIPQEHSPAEVGGARAFWSGTLTFGLVSIPVELYAAVRSRSVSLRSLAADGQPLRRRYVCSKDNRPLERDDIVRGYELDKDQYVIVGDQELEALEPHKSRDIDLRRFVPRDEVDPMLLDRPYILAPAGESTKAYHLLASVLEQKRRAGIATFVMRGKEYLAAIFAEAGLLRAATLHFADELRSPDDIGLPEPASISAGRRTEVEAAIRRLKRDSIDPAKLQDLDAQRVLELAERKRAENKDLITLPEVPPEEAEEPGEVVDIMEVLKRRLEASPEPAPASSKRRPRERKKPTWGRESAKRAKAGAPKRKQHKA